MIGRGGRYSCSFLIQNIKLRLQVCRAKEVCILGLIIGDAAD